MKKVWNVIGILFAVLLSIMLVVVLTVTPVVSAASDFTQTDTIRQIVADVDFESIIQADEGMTAALEEFDVGGEMIQDIMDTEAAEDMIDLYVEDIFSAVEGGNAETAFSAEALAEIMDTHKDELLPIVEGFSQTQLGEEFELSEEETEQMYDTLVDEFAEDFVTMLPTAEDMGIVTPEASESEGEEAVPSEIMEMLQLVSKLRDGKILTSFIVAAAIISVLILVCRWVRFKGFMWLGVCYSISTILSLVFMLMVKGLGEVEVFGISSSILPMFVEKLTKGTVILAILSVLFIVVFVGGRRKCRKLG